MNQIKELHNMESMGGGRGGQAVKPEQVAAMLKERSADRSAEGRARRGRKTIEVT